MKKVRIFTDGACSKNGKSGAKASWACWFPEFPDYSNSDIVPIGDLQTNQRGELMGIAKGVEIAVQKCPLATTDLHIFTDSMYSKNCLTEWLPGWIESNWKTKQGKPVSHRDLIEQTATNLSKFKSYTITHVRAHTGDQDDLSRNNDIVDKMATQVLHPTEETKVVQSNKEEAIPGLPVSLMGPPVSDTTVFGWIKQNLDKLDSEALHTALYSALSKTLKKKGFELSKQRLHRSTMIRLISAKHLIAGGIVVVKEDE